MHRGILMPLPKSFGRDGFQPLDTFRNTRRLMIGTEGLTNTGKTEFILSAPGPGIVICLDRGIDSTLDNPNPPRARRDDFAVKVIAAPLATQASQEQFGEYWNAFYSVYMQALNNPDALTIGLDGDSDSWELQRLAAFGRLDHVPPFRYGNINSARRAMVARAWDSKKIIIATNKMKEAYETKLNNKGEEIGIPTGKMERQGFKDQTYLWHIQIGHLYRPARYSKVRKKEISPQWGLRILTCKSDTTKEGLELWGDDCNFAGLVQTIYPNVSLKEWGL